MLIKIFIYYTVVTKEMDYANMSSDRARDILLEFDEDADHVKLGVAGDLYALALAFDSRLARAYSGLANVKLRIIASETIKRGSKDISALVLEDRAMKEELERAISFAQSSLELEPEDPYSHLALGRCYDYAGDSENAIGEMKLAISLDPLFYTAHFDIGNIYIRAKEYEKALEHLEIATSSQFPSIAARAKNLMAELIPIVADQKNM